MLMKHKFEIPLPPDMAWTLLLDIDRIVPCLPGAELTERIDANTYKGKLSARLGPVSLTFNGTARFEEIDNNNRKARIKASGADLKGRGGANAVAAFRLEPLTDSSTLVLIDTELNLSGAVVQYGRATGMIDNVAAEIISQFAANLRNELLRSHESAVTGSSDAGGNPTRSEARQVAKPISGFSVIFRALWGVLRGFFSNPKVGSNH
jgi:uncharacterized protein